MAGAPPPRGGLRAINALLFGAFSTVGFGLVARPALLAVRSLGLFAPTLPWDVPLGRLFLLLALALAVETIRLGVAVASGAKLRARARVPLLLLVVAAFAARNFAGEPLAPAAPVARLVSALRACADALDRAYPERARYQPDEAALDQALAAVGGSTFVYRGHELPLRARLIGGAERPQGIPRAQRGDRPGDLYVAISADGSRAYLSALTLDDAGRPQILQTVAGRPLIIEARAGTHSAPGRDPLVPEYPGMRTPSQGKAGAAR